MSRKLEIGKSKPRRRDPPRRRIRRPTVNHPEVQVFGWQEASMAPDDRFMSEEGGRDF